MDLRLSLQRWGQHRATVRRWLHRHPRLRRTARLALLGLGLYLTGKVLPHVLPRAPLSRGYAASTAVLDADGHLLRLTLSADEKYRKWTPLSRISPAVIEAFLLYEDRHFFHHPGVNPAALIRATWATCFGGGRRLGGSTITMQLARRLYGIRSSTVGGKLRQMGRALQLELLYTKREILEAYLNLVPFGRNIEGVAAASLIYLHKPPDALLLGEALTLAVMPQNPTRRAPGPPRPGDGPRGSPDRERPTRSQHGASNPALTSARAALLRTWQAAHPEAREEVSLARLPLALHGIEELPFRAPHQVVRLLSERERAPQITSTLDGRLQRLLTRHLRGYVARRRTSGVQNAAAMLVHFPSMEVKASVGSADFWSAEISGQVNGTRAKRSPGSTLKPFIFALALEQGLLHPQTVLRDIPLAFGGFRPENFDGEFAGPLSATEALNRSRNIPALEVAGRLRRPTLHGFLRAAGITGLRPASHYGLALVVGGAEVTMEELVTIYATLGNRGLLRPLRHFREQLIGHPRRLLSEPAAFIALDMLRQAPRPDRVPASRETGRLLPVAWKTGTSSGFRDAWTVGVFGPYVLAVWLGNFSGEPHPALVGGRAAAPLFFEIVDSVVAQLRPAEPTARRPRQLESVAVCPVSGQIPGPHCPHRRRTWFIPGVSPIAICDVHRPVTVELHSGRRACPGFTGPRRTAVFEFWPTDLLALFAAAGIPRRLPPPPGAGCPDEPQASPDHPPRILSPLRGVTYTLRPGHREERIALQVATDADAREVFWFVGEDFIGKTRSGRTLFWRPVPGSHVIRAVDDAGRADARSLEVEVMQ